MNNGLYLKDENKGLKIASVYALVVYIFKLFWRHAVSELHSYYILAEFNILDVVSVIVNFAFFVSIVYFSFKHINEKHRKVSLVFSLFFMCSIIVSCISNILYYSYSKTFGTEIEDSEILSIMFSFFIIVILYVIPLTASFLVFKNKKASKYVLIVIAILFLILSFIQIGQNLNQIGNYLGVSFLNGEKLTNEQRDLYYIDNAISNIPTWQVFFLVFGISLKFLKKEDAQNTYYTYQRGSDTVAQKNSHQEYSEEHSQKKICSVCGAENKSSSHFCGYCGNQHLTINMEKNEEYIDAEKNTLLQGEGVISSRVNNKECSACNSPLDNCMLFCPICGHRNEAETKKVIGYCATCGSNVNPNDSFCFKCGNKICK